ncbi:(2Fe-2S)-binding protein [Streptomyces poriticola]|uniref:(2Fe-2S)-binding protein n=1 Tax=Streptomyces poriticola TaxID=3120506 RepID=UPI002FCDF250
MTDDQHGGRHPEGTGRPGGRWDPLPQGDYDDGATAFVQLPEGGVDALLAAADSPLAAPGHGYTPPQITVTPATTGTDPAATGSWTMPDVPADGPQWPVPDSDGPYAGHHQDPYGAAGQQPPVVDDRFGYDAGAGATGQWSVAGPAAPEAAGDAPTAPGHDVTGQWSIPVADGDLPDESGEFPASSLADQWNGTAPATLPGGAPAPWAPQAAGAPWGDRPRQPGAVPPADEPDGGEPEAAAASGTVEAPAAPSAPGADGDSRGPEQTAAPETTGAAPPPPAGPAEPPADRARTAATSEPGSAPDDPARAPATAEPAAGPGPAAAAGPSATPAADPEQDATDAPTTPDPTPVPPQDPAVPGGGHHDEHPLASYVLRVNGADRPVTDAWIGESLLYVLRERLGLAGAKDGCSQGECGACNVQVDGRLVASCLVPAVTTAGSEVRTVEGLAADGRPSDVQRALARCGAVQCGFCVPGIAMTLHDLLEGNPAPTALETRQALCGNLCRCSGYRGVLRAVEEVVAEREATTAAEAPGTDDGRDTRDGLGGHDAHGSRDAHGSQAAQAPHEPPGTGVGEPRIPHQAGPGAGGVHPSAFETPDTDQPHGDRSYGQDGGHA